MLSTDRGSLSSGAFSLLTQQAAEQSEASARETQSYGHTISNVLVTGMWPRDTHPHTWLTQLPVSWH